MITTQQNQISDSLVNKIKGLLRLTSSSNQHESELAMQKAKALAVKYELDLASIEAFDDKPKNQEPITRESLEVGKRMSICQHFVSRILRNYFNVRIIYSGSRWGGKRIVFVGRNRDIELATYLNNYLNEEFLRLWRKYYAENEKNGVTLRDRGGFIYGLEQGLSEKLKEAQKQTEEQAFTEMAQETSSIPVMEKMEKIKQCYALAITSHQERLEEKVAEFYPHLRKNYNRGTVKNYNAVGAGRAMGRNISVNRPLGQGNGGKIGY